ncbi:hypothetical protein V9T40_011198 [Parthenolecanium corni]|uniref:CHK kinase-like domain-containing protein n=1 Tax=Parthenolecanium corni TaxID=536013 RepID=A0AAN9T4Y1_9HEMI
MKVLGNLAVSFVLKEDQNAVNGWNSEMIYGQIVYRTENNEEKVSAPLALKTMPYYNDSTLMQFFNEIFFYTRTQPFFQKLSSVKTLLPTFYDSFVHSNDQTTKIILIWENLKAQGFRNHKRHSFLELDHLILMLHKLGQFHSYSYVTKHRNPKKFYTLGKWFQYAEREQIENVPNYFRLVGEIGVQRLRQDPRYSSRMTKVEEVLEKAGEFMLQVNTMKPADEPMSVLVHGDYLRGNVMFRYENSQLVDLKMIDMATCRIASPVIDLSLVLYLNADQQTRSQHWNRLIDAYYEGLCQLFGGLGVPSKESILKEFTYNTLYGYFIASHCLISLIEFDRGNKEWDLRDFLPTEYARISLGQIPENIMRDSINQMCSEDSAEVMADILRDMIDRNFI